ncbi:TIGR00730 family Rossman fold protein [Enterovirga sp.]|uniref:LOG family protein n=1 Tax=Enterovirga sp. TaxID=2026350 RepID=UPI00260A3431|nr:TIGR00730 family Rossman fold protein [Enterovirga sp.]MDB5590944.1 family Rossman fold protein [Enterovirga sp.]
MRNNIPGVAWDPVQDRRDHAPELRRICVYCGSSNGAEPAFAEAAAAFGRGLAEAGIELVYGGGDVGLMGVVARSVLHHGGRVTGIIPDFLRRREQMLDEAQELVVVPDMHTRKQMMFDRADAFVALPGGVGTLEELVEQMTWAQLGRHRKPILLLDVNGFWKPLLVLFAHMRQHGFIRPGLELGYLVAERTEDVIPMISDTIRRRGGQDGDFQVERF